jgi:hypothetical protein
MAAQNVLDGRAVLDAIGGELVFRDLPTETDFAKILWFPVDPNGLVSAPLGSLCLTPLALWRNSDGAFAWVPAGGMSVGGDSTFKIGYTFLSGTLALGPALLAGNLVHDTQIVVTVPFDDATATLELGTNVAPVSLNDVAENDPQAIGRYPGAWRDRQAVGAEQTQLVVTPAASTQGSGYVLFTVSV